MKYKDVLNNILNKTVINSVVVTIFIIFLSCLFVRYLMQNKLVNNYQVNNLIVESQDIINRKLNIYADSEALKDATSNYIMITNNGDATRYRILLDYYSPAENDIRASINGFIIKDLCNYNKDNNSYILYEGPISEKETESNIIKLWIKKGSNNAYDNKFKFKLRIEEI